MFCRCAKFSTGDMWLLQNRETQRVRKARSLQKRRLAD